MKRGKDVWQCFGCKEHGDAAALVMKVRSVAFPEAVQWPGRTSGEIPLCGTVQTQVLRPQKAVPSPLRGRFCCGINASGPSFLLALLTRHQASPWLDSRLVLVRETAEKRLWMAEGARALAYLRGRGLDDETIRSWLDCGDHSRGDGSQERRVQGAGRSRASRSPGSTAIVWRW